MVKTGILNEFSSKNADVLMNLVKTLIAANIVDSNENINMNYVGCVLHSAITSFAVDLTRDGGTVQDALEFYEDFIRTMQDTRDVVKRAAEEVVR